MTDRWRIAAISDEIHEDLSIALDTIVELGLTGVELRVVFGKNVIDLSDEEVDDVILRIRSRGMEVVSLASPLLKCVLRDAASVDGRFQKDVFAAPYSLIDQPRLARRAFEIAERTGAPLIRVFSYWRGLDPPSCVDRVLGALCELADEAQQRGVTVGLENEHACNVATGAEAAALLAALDHPALKLVWDPANALVAGERPFPEGYQCLPRGRIAHVHVKDCVVREGEVAWGLIGSMNVDWRGQLHALDQDGYAGWLSVETHWRGEDGDKRQASIQSVRALQRLARNTH